MELKPLAFVIKDAARRHEESWDEYKIEYNISVRQAVEEACGMFANDWYIQPATTMLLFGWDESLEWAEKLLSR